MKIIRFKLSFFLLILNTYLSIKLKRQGENTIVEYKITSRSSLNYYYPYLHKMGLIFFPDMAINYKDLSTRCDDYHCQNCDPLYPNLCYKCATGFYLNGRSCQYECPKGYVTDVLRQICIREQILDSTTLFSKTYTIGSCNNKCGNPSVVDCSCSSECKKSGTCCFDYADVNCDGLIDKGKVVAEECNFTNKDCDICDKNIRIGSTLKCNQCKQKFFLHQGKCIKKCPSHTKEDSNNFICKEMQYCSVENCSYCNEGTINTCKSCERSYYLFNGNCVKSCPMGYRADRISWSCLEYPVISWYYVFPSKGSCKNNCTKEETLIIDCKCDTNCVRRGDCCEDFDDSCLQFIILRKSNVK